MRPSERGFTLIEVLIAVLIVSLVFGLLLESVTRNLADQSRARAGARASQLAADRVRDLKIELEGGEKLEDGVKDGAFEEPDQDMRWQISVAPQTLPLPPDYKGEISPSPLFSASNEPPRATKPGEEAPLRLVQVRVYPVGEEPESVDPFVVLLTAPPDPARLQQLQQQQGTAAGTPANGTQTNGMQQPQSPSGNSRNGRAP
jgi:prepilin-type N-terminal cleavage/methylation domain-containing protein